LALLTSTSVLGCSITDKNYIKSFHAQHPECDKATIEVVYRPDETVEAKGCGTTEVWVARTIFFSGVLDQFAFQTGCPRDQLAWTPMQGAGHPVGVSGCGQKAVYKQVPYVGWVTDSTSKAAATEAVE